MTDPLEEAAAYQGAHLRTAVCYQCVASGDQSNTAGPLRHTCLLSGSAL